MTPLLIGLALALAALAFVAAPLLRRPPRNDASGHDATMHGDGGRATSSPPVRSDVLARDSGAEVVLPAEHLAALEEEAERMIREAHDSLSTCGPCGARTEPDAVFCSRCGAGLGVCPACRHPFASADARFCEQCGAALLAPAP
ncbi:MAG: zinc ribbon domain-containing protein [Gemmatimonadaceae bacterium]